MHDKLTLLIDADVIAFKAAVLNQKSIQFDPDETPAVHLNKPNGLFRYIQDEIDMLMETLGGTDYLLMLSCSSKDGWRKKVLKTYKANRPSPPALLSLAKEIMRTYHPVVEEPKMEGDDLLGIYATDPYLVEGDKVVVSIDKDMKTLPCHIYNPDKDRAAWYNSEAEADKYHMYQTLIGDTTDNYKGCPKVGDKTATSLLNLDSELTHWEKVVAMFEGKGLTEDDALVQARVARILRSGEYDFKKKKVKLWTPPEK